jgi:hypothetical protein
MLLIDANGIGEVVAEATEDIISGQLIKVTRGSGKAYATKTVSGDTATGNHVALAYIDPTEQASRTYVSASLTSAEYATVKSGHNLVAMVGRDMVVQTDQLADGNYLFDSPIAYDFENAGLKLAGVADTVIGRVLTPGIVASKNRKLRIRVSVGSVG